MNQNVGERRQRSRVQGGWSKPPSSLKKCDPQKSQQYSRHCDQLDKAESSQPNPIQDEKSEISRDRKDTEDLRGRASIQSPEMIPNPRASDGALMYKERNRGHWSTRSSQHDILMVEGSNLTHNPSMERTHFTFQQPSKQAAGGGPSTWKPVMPKNFSWVVENKVCAMGFPGEPGNMQYLLDRNVMYLISLTEERQPDVQHFPQITLIPVKVVDFTPPSLEQIDQCLDIIDRANNEGKAVGIHCAYGKGRTGTVLACLFIKQYGMTSAKAIEQIRIFRPQSIETKEQENRVMEYEEIILKTNLYARSTQETIKTHSRGSLEGSSSDHDSVLTNTCGRRTLEEDKYTVESPSDSCGNH